MVKYFARTFLIFGTVLATPASLGYIHARFSRFQYIRKVCSCVYTVRDTHIMSSYRIGLPGNLQINGPQKARILANRVKICSYEIVVSRVAFTQTYLKNQGRPTPTSNGTSVAYYKT